MNFTNLSASIIIPNFNGRRLLAQNIPQVISASPDCEIIVVDDASTDDSVKFIESNFPQIKLIKLAYNQRFAAACNAGVNVASNEIIILLNTDVVPHLGFLDFIYPHFKNDEVFAVACKEIQTIPSYQESGRNGMNFARGLMIHWKSKNQNLYTTAWVSGGSGAFRKSIWHQIGGMDPILKPAYEEDRDLCYRAAKQGYLIEFEPQSIVDHHHETTNRKYLGRKSMHLASFKNQLIFVWKNITDLELIIQHFLWLPYHLIFTTIRSRGEFLIAFMWALLSIPQIIHFRIQNSKNITKSDREIIQETSQY